MIIKIRRTHVDKNVRDQTLNERYSNTRHNVKQSLIRKTFKQKTFNHERQLAMEQTIIVEQKHDTNLNFKRHLDTND